jgi:hypothetical protein
MLNSRRRHSTLHQPSIRLHSFPGWFRGSKSMFFCTIVGCLDFFEHTPRHRVCSGVSPRQAQLARPHIICILRPQVHSPRKNVSAAAAVTAAPPLESTSGPTGLNAEQRAELAEQLGYRQIGEDLPDDITLKQVIGTLPRDVSISF